MHEFPQSSSIAAAGYDPDARELHLRYRSGPIYVYFEVDPDEFDALLAAESKGTYVNRVLKPRNHPYERREDRGP